jgi:hypothetical protein
MKTDKVVIRSQYVIEQVRKFQEAGKKVKKADVDAFTKKAHEQVRAHEAFINFFFKFTERCVLTSMCIRENMDVPENDMLILEELYNLYDTDRLHWITKKPEEQEMAVQQVLFADEMITLDDLS